MIWTILYMHFKDLRYLEFAKMSKNPPKRKKIMLVKAVLDASQIKYLI